MAPKRTQKPLKAPPASPPTSSLRRVLLSLFAQAVVVAFLYRRLSEAGIVDVVGSYLVTYNPAIPACGLLPAKEFILLSDRVVGYARAAGPGFVHVRGGRIAAISVGGPAANRHALVADLRNSRPNLLVLDFDRAVIGPGLIDTHIHMNEPGREEWEGMASATRAAAAGGFTAVVDMPLNSDPCTTTPTELRRKIVVSRQANKTAIDVGFWAGLVPGNAKDSALLRAMVRGGAMGFKAFMSPSGINDFPNVSPDDIAAALPFLRDLNVPLLVHAELVDERPDVVAATKKAPRSYGAWLESRPPRFERNAVMAIIAALGNLTDMQENAAATFQRNSKTFSGGFGVHVVHVADAEALDMIVAAKRRGLPISAEICPHYLHFAAEDVADGDTRFKCAPPFRDASNRAALLAAFKEGKFDSAGSDHSPAPPSMKELESGDFLKAWGGIAGLQYSLPATWHAMQQQGMPPEALHRMWSSFPAALAGMASQKGSLKPGMHADVVVWDPEAWADTTAHGLLHRHKPTPYANKQLRGRVLATFVRGSQVFDVNRGVFRSATCGSTVLYRRM
jgi:allantoinase